MLFLTVNISAKNVEELLFLNFPYHRHVVILSINDLNDISTHIIRKGLNIVLAFWRWHNTANGYQPNMSASIGHYSTYSQSTRYQVESSRFFHFLLILSPNSLFSTKLHKIRVHRHERLHETCNINKK